MRRAVVLLLVSVAAADTDPSALAMAYLADPRPSHVALSEELRSSAPEAAPRIVEGWATDDPKRLERIEYFFKRTYMTRMRDAIVAGMRHADRRVRIRAALFLVREADAGAPAPDALAVSILHAAVGESEAALRDAAIEALSALGLAADRVVPVLLELLLASTGEVRLRAIEAFRAYGPKAAAAIPALAERAAREREVFAIEAVRSLAYLGPDGFAPIRQCLDRPEPELQYWAVRALGDSGTNGRGAVDRLVEMAQRHGTKAEVAALDALVRIAPEEGRVQALVAADLASGDAVRVRRAEGIVTHEKIGRHFVEPNRALLRAPRAATRVRSARILAGAGLARAEVLAAMTEVARGEELADQALELIGELGPMAADALPQLCARVGTQRQLHGPLGRCAAGIGTAGLDALAGALRHKDKETRFAALVCLHGFGPLAKPARAGVAKLAQDPDLAGAANAVLRSIDGDAIPEPSEQLSLDSLAHDDPRLRRLGVDRLRGKGYSPLRPQILASLEQAAKEDADEVTRAGALRALTDMVDADRLIPMVRHALEAGRSNEALEILVYAARDLGPAGRVLQPDLERLLSRQEPPVFPIMLVLALYPDAADRLLARLKAAPEHERQVIVVGLGHSSMSHTDPVRRALFDQLFDDPSEIVRGAAFDALWRVGSPPEGLPRVLAALEKKSEPRFTSALMAAGGYPQAYGQIAPHLLPLLDKPARQQLVLVTLGRWGSAAKPALPRLRKMRKAATGELKGLLDEVIAEIEG